MTSMQKMLKKAQAIQKKLENDLAEFDKEEFAFSYQKSVELKIKGNLEITDLKINKDLIDPNDKSMLEEMLAEALNEAIVSVQEEREEITNKANAQYLKQ